MPKLVARLQALKERAIQLNAMINAAPAKAAQVRDAVQATTGQLQALRSNVEGAIQGIKTTSDSSLAEALVDVTASLGVFERAGYMLTGLDLEQGVTPRVILHLDQLPGDASGELPALMREHASQPGVLAVLKSISQANALRDKVRLPNLDFRGLIIHIGPAPTVRLCWRMDLETGEEPTTTAVAPPVLAQSSPSLAQPSYEPRRTASLGTNLGEGSFFGRPGSPAGQSPALASGGSSTTTAGPLPRTGKQEIAAPAESTDPLARFKKMPDLTRRTTPGGR